MISVSLFIGSFGQVFYGLLTNIMDKSVTEVAMKTIKGTNLCASKYNCTSYSYLHCVILDVEASILLSLQLWLLI